MKATLLRVGHRKEARGLLEKRKKNLQKEHARQQEAKKEALRRTENAATLIQAVLRTFHAKKKADQKRLEKICSINIQRAARGKLAKNEAYQRSLESRRVVSPGYSLRMLLKRSKILRRFDPWREHRDCATNAVYYYNSKTLETQWTPPYDVLETFICNWGFCDLQFETFDELVNHRIRHKWMCPACFKKNSIDCYPKCTLCENDIDTDGLKLGKVSPDILSTKELFENLKVRNVEANLAREGLIEKLTALLEQEESERIKIEANLNDEELEIHKLFEVPVTRDIVPLPDFPEFSQAKIREENRRLEARSPKRASTNLRKKSIAHEARLERRRQKKKESTLQSQEELAEERRKLLIAKAPIGYKIPENLDIESVYKTKIQNGEGCRKYINGCNYSGNLINGIMQGKGVYRWGDGSKYEGDWVKGKRYGKGIFTGADGSKYVGDWLNGKRHGHGVYKTASKEVYEGEWRDGFMQGRGAFQSRNGDTYFGRWKRGKYQGLGRFERANGDHFFGRCNNGKAEGIGILRYADGEVYKGEWKEDKRHGKGVCYLKTGNVYTGEWKNGRYNGFGVFESVSTAERYAGNWDDGRMTGTGKYQFSNGDIYEGTFIDGVASGQGVYYYKNSGHVYNGEWKNDEKLGQGKFYFASGAFYDGMWKNGKINGYGSFTYKNGDMYVGAWKDNLKHGKGSFRFTNGNLYEGEFYDNKMEGIGTMKYSPGHSYKGEWKSNRKDGWGEFKYADGNRYVGNFRQDEKEGYGTLYYHPGTKLQETYAGQFAKGIRHGKGKYTYAGGEEYDGEWESGIRHGYGEYQSSDFVYKGNFVNDLYQGKGCGKWLKNRKDGKEGDEYVGIWHRAMKHGRGVLTKSNGDSYSGGFSYGKKQGPGTVTFADGNTFKGNWENGIRIGRGRYTLHARKQADPLEPDFGNIISLTVVGC